MTTITRTFTLLLVSVIIFSCASEKLDPPQDYELKNLLNRRAPNGTFEDYILPDPQYLESIPQDPKNPLSQEKVELGRMLFFETGLGIEPIHDTGMETYSCSSCHIPKMGFMPGRAQGIADGGTGFGFFGELRDKADNYEENEMDVQGARAINLINVAFTTNTSWSGQFGANNVNIGTENLWHLNEATEVNHLGYFGLESQNIEGLKLHRMMINKDLTDEHGYTEMFDAAFPDFAEGERYTLETGSLAISAFLRSLISNEAPFQSWLKGDENAMTVQQKRGATLFFDKAGCYRCHNGPALNNSDHFYALGVKSLFENGQSFNTGPDDIRNFGRGGFTQKPEDMFKFKVPQLYNMRNTPFYFHGSSKKSMKEVVEYFNDGIPENAAVPAENIAPQFHPLFLSETEMDDLVEFLENGLNDANIGRHVPEYVLSGNCFPNNDTPSRRDLGCE